MNKTNESLSVKPLVIPKGDLPDYENPPVTEVALSVQFNRLQNFRIAHMGLLWEKFGHENFPQTEEHEPIISVIERFGIIPNLENTGVQILESFPLPKCWFINATGSRLIQIQMDRFVYNWRKREGEHFYPHYPDLRNEFVTNFKIFQDFLTENHLDTIEPNQCEVSYVNTLISGDGWERIGETDKILTVSKLLYFDDFLGEPEDSRIALRYIIPNESGEPIGRLHINLAPGYRVKDRVPILALSLTARGLPKTEDLDGILTFFDLGRQCIVRGFTSITTAEMHKIWRRIR